MSGIDDLDDYGCEGDCDYCETPCHDPSEDGIFDEDDFGEEDSGFLGSMLENQLLEEGQRICVVCGKKVASVIDEKEPNPCKEECHASFKRLFEVRCQIGLHDLKTRGFD